MKIIYYSKDDQMLLTDTEFVQAMTAFDQNAKIYLPRLDVTLSPHFVWAGKKQPSMARRKLHDGTYAVLNYGRWVDENDQSVKIDLRHYPELAKDLTDDDLISLEEKRTEATKK